MPNLEDVKRELATALRDAGVEPSEARREADLIAEHATGLTAAQQVLKAFDPVDEELVRVMLAVVRRREKRIPLQYCFGYAYFMGLKLVVRPGVLIPRCDTETLVELAVDRLKDKPQAQVADIGSGSGAIAIALLKRLPDVRVTAIDISPEAVALTRENAIAHDVFNRLQLVHHDWRAALPAGLDAIISNPPYIPRRQRSTLPPEVAHEPEQALFGDDDDGLAFYRKLSAVGRKHLKVGGFVLVEVGDGQAQDVMGIFSRAGWGQIDMHNDLNGLARVVSAVP